MRELKFRVWDEINKKMYSAKNVATFDFESNCAWIKEGWKGGRWVYFSKSKRLQYTGLKDKNGREIYENDVIYWEINNGVGIESYTAVVRWSERVGEGWKDCYKWLVEYRENYLRGDYDELSTPAAYNDALEVIGNIYENPELLEGESN